MITSITKQGKFEPFGLQVAEGQIPYHSAVTVFGYNPDVDTAEESVWSNGGVVPHPVSTAILTLSSTSANDTAAGTGARTVYIAGVDGNYTVVSETVTLNGVTAVSTTNSYLAINQLYIVTAGSGLANDGQISAGTGAVTGGIPAVIYDLIAAGYNQRTTGHYTVPAGHTAYMSQGVFTAGQVSGSTSITGFLKTTNSSQIQYVAAVVTLNNGSVQYDFDPPLLIPEKTCVGASAIGRSNNNSVSSMFNLILVEN